MRITRTIPPSAPPLGLKKILRGLFGLFTGDRPLRRFECELKEYYGARSAFTLSSGKAALVTALAALKRLSPGRTEVVIPAYTCYSVPSAVLKAGLKVVPCDVDPAGLDLEIGELEKLVTKETLCVITNHFLGHPSDVRKIKEICAPRGAYLIEDTAQAMGVRGKDGRLLGTTGDAAILSLGRGKNITCGSGGVILARTKEVASAVEKEYAGLETDTTAEGLAELIKLSVMWIFIRPWLYWLPAGMKTLHLGETFFHEDFPVKKLSRAKGGLLSGWRRELEKANSDREENSDYYSATLPGLAYRSGVFLRYPVLAATPEDRDRVVSGAGGQALGISGMYPGPVSAIEEIRHLFKGKSYPGAHDLSERLLTLPTHGLVKDLDRLKVVSLLAGVCEDDKPYGVKQAESGP